MKKRNRKLGKKFVPNGIPHGEGDCTTDFVVKFLERQYLRRVVKSWVCESPSDQERKSVEKLRQESRDRVDSKLAAWRTADKESEPSVKPSLPWFSFIDSIDLFIVFAMLCLLASIGVGVWIGVVELVNLFKR